MPNRRGISKIERSFRYLSNCTRKKPPRLRSIFEGNFTREPVLHQRQETRPPRRAKRGFCILCTKFSHQLLSLWTGEGR